MLGFGEKNLDRAEPAGKLVKYGGLNGNPLLYAIVATATIGFSLFGYDQGLMSGIIGAEQFNREFPAVSFQIWSCGLSPEPFSAVLRVVGVAAFTSTTA
jgi:hypothetical protein